MRPGPAMNRLLAEYQRPPLPPGAEAEMDKLMITAGADSAWLASLKQA